MTGAGIRPRLALFAAACMVTVASAAAAVPPAGATTYAKVSGQGSTYAALAFQQWTQGVQLGGLDVNYTATNSAQGLQAYAEGTADFAGTEGEYTELYADTPGTANAKVTRGFAYTPDVAGAVAIMYHVALNPTGSNPVDYLHLSRLTVAKIWLGVINNWDSPTITNDNKGLVLPNEPISLYYRTGESGTTALFYDFVQHTDPTDYVNWARTNGFPTSARVWEIDDPGQNGNFPPQGRSEGYSGSTQQAQAVASPQGLWSISYDEFGYAKVFHDSVAWIGNQAGTWTLPYALNIAAALKTAQLAPDTSQTLAKVYTNPTPLTYPISAYSYLLYQCAPTSARPTCKTPYSSPSIEATMGKFMRYIACTGQVKMATIGYSPLPPQLSQFMANAIGYMTNTTPETLTVKNCANPQFQGGNLGVGALPPKDPLATVKSLAPGATSASGGGASSAGSAGSAAGGKAGSGARGTGGAGAAAGSRASSGGTGSGGTASSGSGAATGPTAASTSASGSGTRAGASDAALGASPVAWKGPAWGSGSPWPVLALVLLLAVPVAVLTVAERRRRRRLGGSGDSEPPPSVEQSG